MMKFLNGFSDFAADTLKKWNVPGAAVAVVQGGKIILAEGYGYRDVERGLPITPQTVFPIGSATKAFSAMALGILVDEGKLTWDQPILDFLPTFQLQNKLASERMTALDLLSHRSGLPGHDLAWIGSQRSRQELFDALVHLEPTKEFRTYFQYSNLMYMVTAHVVKAVSGQSWETFVQERLLSPLGMSHSSPLVRDVIQLSDYSLPYKETKAGVKELLFGKTDTDTSAIAPAGALNSNLLDMAQWLLFNLGYGQEGIVSDENRLFQQCPHMPILSMPQFDFIWQQPEIGDVSYGLGWFLYPYRGHKVVEHGGNVSGFSALVSMMPELDLGIVILTNLEGRPANFAPTVLAFNIYDRLLDLNLVGWHERIYGVVRNVLAYFAQQTEKQAAERKDLPPSQNLDVYVGDYHHSGYGVVSVKLEKNQVMALLNDLSCTLEYVGHDEFRLKHQQFELGIGAQFSRDEKGEIKNLSIQLESTANPIVFVR